jgi:ABC-type phosphate transport system substrate-binding protein
MRKILAFLLMLASSAQAEVAVIVHPKNTVATPAPKEVQDIFLGRKRTFADGRFALPIDQSSPLRAEFYQTLTARPIEQINAYWARLLFTGQASPPPQMPDDESVLKAVRENEGAIGYVAPAHIDKSVRLLLLLKP